MKDSGSIIGRRFGGLIVLDLDHVEKGRAFYLCKCDCGNVKVVDGYNLKRGFTTSCGCKKHERRSEELTGKRFGRLYVVRFDHMGNRGKSYWLCKCDCGNETVVERSSLLRGATKSCGCGAREGMRKEDLTGRRFGKIYVVGFDHKNYKSGSYWLCRCDCGNEILLRTRELISGRTTSCGCANKRSVQIASVDYDSLYNIWINMKQRCENVNNPAYKNYGGRGINICDEWCTFEKFRDWALTNGYDHDLTIDRIDNDNGYYPDNCRWVDNVVQANNRRSNRYITYNGKTHTIAEWAKIFRIDYQLLRKHVLRNNMCDFEEYFCEC